MDALAPRDVDAWAVGLLRGTNPWAAWLLRLLAPASGFRQFCRVYAYFRWADDVVDAPGRDPAAVRVFAARQRVRLDAGGLPEHPAEAAVDAALAEAPALRVAVDGMWDALDFDVARGSGPLPDAEIEAQIARIGDAYLAGLAWCVGVREPLPPAVLELSRAATAAHQLRDLEVDLALGYCNVPVEVLGGADPDPAALAPWVRARARAQLARFDAGLAATRAVRPWRARIAIALFGWRYRRLAARLATG
jgi:phytoene/squalene synthetase